MPQREAWYREHDPIWLSSKGDGKSPRVIVEIVVHHDVEESTEERYRESGTPVIKIRPAWETVDNLREQIFADEILNVDDNACRGGKETDRRRREWLVGIEGKLNNAIQAGQEGQGKLAPITKDRFGSYLRSDTKRRVNTNARKLSAAGFTQQLRRPTLFRVDVDEWRIFADLDSTEVMKIWEVDCLPGLYAFPEDTEPPRCKECALDIVRGILERNGVEIRRYFLDHGTHNHWTPGGLTRGHVYFSFSDHRFRAPVNLTIGILVSIADRWWPISFFA